MQSSRSSSFRLLSRIDATEDRECMIPVSKYVSERTGMRAYVCQVSGPVVKGYFSLGTEAHDDDGLPHTLEHLVFLGSEDYPHAGVIDILANKVYAAGTNAWTEVDNTTYTISTLEKNGFLQLLPIYLDHILYPLLNESGYITEVYHVNEEGEDAGVVYSEMQSVEMEDENIVERAMHRAMYPDGECGYRYETGGVLHNLRTSCSHKKVVDYHKKMYRADNLAIVIAGQINDDEVIKVLSKFEEKILSKDPRRVPDDKVRPFSRPISSLTNNVDQTVLFPSDSEANTNGIVSVNWRGPHISQMRELIAFDLLFYYLANSSISPLQSHFIQSNSYCNKIEYKIYEYAETCLGVSFTNVQLDSLDRIKGELMSMLADLVSKKKEFDMNRMQSIIKMKIAEIKDKCEDSPHETISHLCIGDFLYGSFENQNEFKQRFLQTAQFESLKTEQAEYWLALIDKYLLKAFSVSIIAKPSESLMHSISEEEKSRVESRKKTLGKKGLRDCKRTVENAIAQNDGEDVPDDVFKQLTVPSLENVRLKDLYQFFTSNIESNKSDLEAFNKNFNRLERLKHLQMQVDHLEGTHFVHAEMIVDTQALEADLREYLELFVSLLFELPIKHRDISMTHEQVVYELNKDLLEFDASIGLNGSQFDPGSFSNYLTIFVKAPANDYELAVKWLKLIAFHTVFDRKQIKIAVQNMLKEIKKRKTQASDVIHSIMYELYFKPDANIRINNFIRQEAFLNKILDELNSDIDPTAKTQVENKLELMRSRLLENENIRFYLCADLRKLAAGRVDLDQIWLEHFSPSTSYQNERAVFLSCKPFEVVRTSSMKRNSNNNNELVFSADPRKDFIVSLGSTESAYLKSIASCDVLSHKHPKYAALLVLIEYFCQTEGPLWEAVRGPGYCYGMLVNLSPDKGHIELNLDECSNLSKAYEATRNTFMKHLNDEDEFDENLYESAKNSLIFLLIDDLISVSNYSSYSMSCHFKGIEINEIQELIKKINKIEMSEMRQLIKDYIVPLFNNETSNCLIVSQPAKVDLIIKDFEKKYDRKLNLIDKIENCLAVLSSS